MAQQLDPGGVHPARDTGFGPGFAIDIAENAQARRAASARSVTTYSCAGTGVERRRITASTASTTAPREIIQDTLTRKRRVLGDDHPRTLHLGQQTRHRAGDLRALGHDDEANRLEEWVRSYS